MDNLYFRQIVTAAIFVILAVMSFFLLKPILLSIIIGIILAFIFNPVYARLNNFVHSKNLSASLICLLLILLIILPVWFLTPILIDQSFKIYLASQQIDFIQPLKNIFPSLFASDEFSAEIGSILSSFLTKMTNFLVNFLSKVILNFPTLFLQLLVVFFTFFFVLRDKDSFINYIKSIMPFSQDIQNKIFESSKEITSSVIYGQVIVGILQGITAGIGFFIFKVPNPLILTLLASLAGIFPVIGTAIIWVPVTIYLLIAGNTWPAIGVAIFGLISSLLDNLLKPIIVSKRTRMHSSIILISMVGGLFLFGVLGFILGPLIIAYLLIILEIYRNKQTPGIFLNN
ncbi:MAG: AI-2E family transporter [Nanoarchaeota archaeon]|nr:AI-2E family transporter [Nanoarchaeota archaeon]